MLGYDTDRPGQRRRAVATPTSPACSYPTLIGSALFEQERKRTGGLIDVQFRPTDDLELDVQYFTSDLEADNYNRNYLLWGAAHHRPTDNGQAPDPGYVVRNNTLVAGEASRRPADTALCGVYDQISRPGAEVQHRTSSASTASAQSATRSTLQRPDRHVGGPRRDADAGRVRDAHVGRTPARATS